MPDRTIARTAAGILLLGVLGAPIPSQAADCTHGAAGLSEADLGACCNSARTAEGIRDFCGEGVNEVTDANCTAGPSGMTRPQRMACCNLARSSWSTALFCLTEDAPREAILAIAPTPATACVLRRDRHREEFDTLVTQYRGLCRNPTDAQLASAPTCAEENRIALIEGRESSICRPACTGAAAEDARSADQWVVLGSGSSACLALRRPEALASMLTESSSEGRASLAQYRALKAAWIERAEGEGGFMPKLRELELAVREFYNRPRASWPEELRPRYAAIRNILNAQLDRIDSIQAHFRSAKGHNGLTPGRMRLLWEALNRWHHGCATSPGDECESVSRGSVMDLVTDDTDESMRSFVPSTMDIEEDAPSDETNPAPRLARNAEIRALLGREPYQTLNAKLDATTFPSVDFYADLGELRMIGDCRQLDRSIRSEREIVSARCEGDAPDQVCTLYGTRLSTGSFCPPDTTIAEGYSPLPIASDDDGGGGIAPIDSGVGH